MNTRTAKLTAALLYSVLLLCCAGAVVAQTLPRGVNLEEQPTVERRFALIIGNSGYQSSPLINPPNDARAMAAALRLLGFEVTSLINASQREMKIAARDFGARLSQGGIGLFYYAGHGLQIKGRNYLVPVGAAITREADVEIECVDVDATLAQLERNNATNIVILDACRNNPFARSWRSATQGLAQVNAPSGTFIAAYATAPGSVAADGVGNGLYTEELLQAIRDPGLSIEEVFKRVRVQVRTRSQGQQVPWDSSSLEGAFYFTRGAAPARAAFAPPTGNDFAHAATTSGNAPRAPANGTPNSHVLAPGRGGARRWRHRRRQSLRAS
ncbi:MAG: caspase family protein [Blastocatellia bacterium]